MRKIFRSIRLLCMPVLLLASWNVLGSSDESELKVTFRGETLSMTEALSLYVQFNSVSGREKEAGEWIKELCIENGLFIQQMGDKDGNYNFAASIYPLKTKLPNIIFLNHIDIVPAKQLAGWKHDPYSGIVDNNELYGRGAFDNKGNAIMQLFSILEIRNRTLSKNLPFNLTLLAVSCEETQTKGGVQYVIDHYLDDLNPELVIGEGAAGLSDAIDEPIDAPIFCISLNHKKALWLELELEYKTLGHGSVSPHKYANKEMNEALFRLLHKKQKMTYNDLNVDLLKQMGELYKGTKKLALKHPRMFKGFLKSEIRKQPELFALFSNTITLTSIESSTHTINTIPNKVTALLDCRLLPEQSSEEFLKKIKRKLKNDDIKINIIQAMPNMVTTAKSSVYYENLSKAIKEVYPESYIFSTLLPNFNDVGAFRSKGVMAYGVIPVVLEKKYLESLHNVNERIPIDILDKGKSTYVRFIELLLQEENLIVKK